MKKAVGDLAIFGGAPAFSRTLHVGVPNVGNRQRLFQRIEDMLDRRWLTNNGCYVQELERRLAEWLGVRHCVCVCNGTVGLELALRAAGVSGEVIVPSFTFIATVHALQWLGITPVFCDIDPQTFNIDARCVEALITPRTSAILGVHTWGRACDVEALAGLARRHGLRLMFDAAHALGCEHNGTMIGGFGNAEVFSFHATKFFNTFEGGAVATNDDGLANQVRSMRNFGFSGYDAVSGVGTNGKMTEVCAAMGLTSLEQVEEVMAVNRRNFGLYREAFAGLPGISLMPYDDRPRSNYQYIVVDVDARTAGLSRDALVQVLHAEAVLARRYFYPGCHQMEPYRSLYPNAGAALPVTEDVVQRLLILPTGETIGRDEIEGIAGVLELALRHAETVTARVAATASSSSR